MKFNYNNKDYELSKDNLQDFFNDEESEIIDIDAEFILNLLEGHPIDFENAYYSYPCECTTEKNKDRTYKFLEYHFYVYTKENKYVTNSLEIETSNISITKLERDLAIDNSYVVSIIVCENCGKYNIEIEQLGE